MGSTAAPAVVFDALVEHIPLMFPARALETAREARALPLIVQPKMNTGKEFPSTCIRFPSSPSFARESRDPLPLRYSE